MAWGRQTTGASGGIGGGVGGVGGEGANGAAGIITGVGAADALGESERRINVVATGSVDQTIKVWTP